MGQYASKMSGPGAKCRLQICCALRAAWVATAGTKSPACLAHGLRQAIRHRSTVAGFDFHLVKPAEADVFTELLAQGKAPTSRGQAGR
jgi:hypothetical protein